MVIGLIITLVTEYKFFTKEEAADTGNIEVSADKPHFVDWAPYPGTGIMVVGGILFIAARRRQL